MVMVLGVDVHKDTHTVVAVDQVGRAHGERTVRATDAGHRQLLRLGAPQFPRRAASGRSRTAGTCRPGWNEPCSPPGKRSCGCRRKLMAGARSGARTRGKSDPIDAFAIARAALREPDLPAARHDEALPGAETAGRPP